ncbi:DUF4352 domain-containing protein [Alkalicoccobacillus gibsonii]|uniref:DUF4352 domain-containing protein n=1 Tax=Alkalicoccobacillus gibsonii TaxID=79881 RepID=UPI003511B546
MMKNRVFASITLTMFILFLTACGDTEEPATTESVLEKETNETTEAEVEDKDENETESDAEDQLDLRMGDTATIHSTIGTYEITLNRMEYKEEVDGERSDLEAYLLAEYTLKNIGDEPIQILDSVSRLEAKDILEASGEPNVAGSYPSVDSFEEGELQLGESVSGEVLFNVYDADVYYLNVIQGLVASGGIKNDVVFTIDKEEMN